MPSRPGLTLTVAAPLPFDAEALPALDGVALPRLADLVCASTDQMADRARAALAPVLPHQALVIVTPHADGLPVRIAAPSELRERLGAIDWVKVEQSEASKEAEPRPVTGAPHSLEHFAIFALCGFGFGSFLSVGSLVTADARSTVAELNS